MASRATCMAVLLLAAMALPSLTFFDIPGGVAAASPSAGQDVLCDPVKPIIYWAGADGNDLKFVNSTTGDIIDSIVVGEGPSSICLSSDGSTLYVAIPSYKCVVVVDANSRLIIGNISLSFYPLSVRLDGRGYMYVSGSGSDTGWIYAIDMGTRKVKDSVYAGPANQVIEISPNGTIMLAMQMETSPVKIYKYDISSGAFYFIDVDNHDLGSNLQGETIDWARDTIYLALGGPYGITLVSVSTLDSAGFYQMDAYPSCVALSADHRFIFGAHHNYYDSAIWMYNVTDGTFLGKTSYGGWIEHLAIAHDLRSAYIGPPIYRINLAPIIEHLYPVPDSLLGYSPMYFSVRFGRSMQDVDLQNATAAIDATNLALSPYDMDGFWIYCMAEINQTLSEGTHNINVSLLWLGQTIWKNESFNIDRNSSQALRPALYAEEPANYSVQSPGPLVARASVVYPNSDFVVQGGWISLDGVNITTVFENQSLIGYLNASASLGWHNLSACAYWDGGLGNTWANWTFVVMAGPTFIPIYPAVDQVLKEMPDHIEVEVQTGSGGSVWAPQLFLDMGAVTTVMTPNGTMRADISPLTKAGTHNVRATINWQGGRALLDWQFSLDMFIGPSGEVMTSYKYKEEFSLLVPEGENWSLEVDAELSGEVFPIVMYGPIFGSFATNLIVESAKDNQVQEDEEYLQEQLDQAVDELQESGIDASIVWTPNLRNVDNHTALIATISLGYSNVYQDIAIIASEDHKMVWIIILSFSTTQFDAYNKMFDITVNSFKIELRPASSWSALQQEAIGIGLAAIAGGVAGAVVWLTRNRRAPKAPKQP